ncbi:hypothetical protein [Pseudonocardia adelaidensis]|uniref:Uncharacterized protein n=1 Tax=Pseudonocardia adelaidensis TaxID=648754 RepID=A0ABP9NNY5_9PSEU
MSYSVGFTLPEHIVNELDLVPEQAWQPAGRTAEGKTIPEIRRCPKRYVARELYRTLTATMTPNQA